MMTPDVAERYSKVSSAITALRHAMKNSGYTTESVLRVMFAGADIAEAIDPTNAPGTEADIQARLKINTKGTKGSTTLELLLVVAIIALLTGIALPAVARAAEHARRTVALTTAHANMRLQAELDADQDTQPPIPLGP